MSDWHAKRDDAWQSWRDTMGDYIASGSLSDLRDGMSEIATAARALAATLAGDERVEAKRSRRALVKVDEDARRIVRATEALERHVGEVE